MRILLCLFFAIPFTACKEKSGPSKVDQSVLKAKVDSLTAIKLDSAINKINNDCLQNRDSIINHLADSIVKERLKNH